MNGFSLLVHFQEMLIIQEKHIILKDGDVSDFRGTLTLDIRSIKDQRV